MKKIIIPIEIMILILLLCVSIPRAEVQEYKYYILRVTAYYPGPECTYPFDDGFTATGAKAGYGCIAIDPEGGPLKLGQKVFIEGYGHGICNDVGGAIKGWEADVCYNTLQEAIDWGVRLVRVYVIEEQNAYENKIEYCKK